MLSILNNLTLTVRMAGQVCAYVSRGRWRQTGPVPRQACGVPPDFFGVCVANAPESACDDYVIARLKEIGIRHVRLDFTYIDREAFTERFLDRLLTERFRVCLHLVQPREDARAMFRRPEVADRWRAFVGEMLDRYGSRADLIEIGATCNRRKWSGYWPAAFFAAWKIAWEEARGRNLAIAGPNVTDFEPIYNAAWLGEFQRSGLLPGVHTDNLFVERATEPEAFDPKVAGRRLAGWARGNLVRKAQVLQDIGAWTGAPTLMCAHVTWSLRRIARVLEDVEEKQADYLARYLCLAAASGALERVYWGPLIGQREGLIDDGTSEYPEIPHVTYYEQARGKIEDYRPRPAFRTLQTVRRFLAGATFWRCPATGAGLEILEFSCTDDGRQPAHRSPQGEGGTTDNGRQTTDDKTLQSEIKNQKSKILHVVWTTDGNGAVAGACYPPERLARAEIYDRDGQRLKRAPRMFSESPVFLVWQDQTADDGRGQNRQTPNAQRPTLNVEWQAEEDRRDQNRIDVVSGVRCPASGVGFPIPGFRFARRPGWDFDIVRPEAGGMGLAGVYLAEENGTCLDIQALLDLLRNEEITGSNGRRRTTDFGNHQSKIINQKSKILRASRNTVWSVQAPWDPGRTLVIKAFKRRGIIRRLLDHGKPDKARRSWNGAQELIRRGLYSPTPLACLAPEQPAPGGAPRDRTSYYICDAFAPAWSARDVFNAFSKGAAKFQGYSTHEWYEAMAVFLQKLHTRGVFFRDLSAGNLLARKTAAGNLEFALIDTARARFHRHSLGLRQRLCDLVRICHPLYWPGRRVFVEKYLAHNGRRFRWWMKIPFCLYDGKHRIKNALKKIGL